MRTEPMQPTDEQLRVAARRTYGTQCSQRFCKADFGDRGIDLSEDLRAQRDDALEGTWIVTRVFIADDSIEGRDD